MSINTQENTNSVRYNSDLYKQVAAYVNSIGDDNDRAIDHLVDFFAEHSSQRKAVCYCDKLFLREGETDRFMIQVNNDLPTRILSFDGNSIASMPFEEGTRYSRLPELNYNFGNTQMYAFSNSARSSLKNNGSNNG